MAYNSNISPGNAPLLWSNINDAFDIINNNFALIGSTLASNNPKTIANVDQGNPVRVVTVEAHGLTNGQKATIVSTGVSQIDGNEYYVDVIDNTEVRLYTDAALTTAVDGTAHDAYPSSGGTITGKLDFEQVDFENLTSDLNPKTSDTNSLGTFSKQWKEVHVESKSSTPGSENNGLWLGLAKIEGDGTTINLPLNSTVNGNLIIDPDKTFFKEVQIDSGDVIVANEFVDSLNLISGTAIQLTVDSGAESITINNDGVTRAVAGSGVTISSNTGDVTFTNSGVLSVGNTTTTPAGLTAGEGIAVDTSTGNITLTNLGVIDLEQGFGITLSRDDTTGIVTVTNSAPAVNTFGSFAVQGQDSVSPDNTADTLEIVEGANIVITTDATNDKITFSFDNVTDIVGSVFAADSTLLVDATTGKILGDVEADVVGDVTGNVTGDLTGNVVGDLRGSVFADDSGTIVDAVTGELFGNLTGDVTGDLTGNVVGDVTGNLTGDVTGDVTGTLTGDVTGNVTGNLTGYQTGDMTGSVFGDDSTKLVDGVESKIVGPIESDNIRGSFIGTVFADDSTQIINPEGSVIGTIAPGAPAPASETEAAPVGEIRVDDNYVYVRKSTGWGKISIGSWV